MFAPSPLAGPQSYSLDTLNSDPAEMSAAKRARVAEAMPLAQLDLTKLTIDKRTVDGKTIYDILLDGEIPHINLTPGTSLDVKFGFDMIGETEQRSFHPDSKVDPKAAKNESLGFALSVDRDLETMLERLDDRCRELCAAAGLEGEWKPFISHPYPTFKRYVNLKVGLKGVCTDLRIQDGDELKQGSGWDFLQACEASICGKDYGRGFSTAKVKVSVKLRPWSMNGKCSVSVAPVFLVIKPQPKPIKATPFDDDIEW